PSQRQASVRRVNVDRAALRDTTQAVERAQRTVRSNRELIASRENRSAVGATGDLRSQRQASTRSAGERATRENPFSRGEVSTRERATVGAPDSVRDRSAVRGNVPGAADRSVRTETPSSARVTTPTD